MNGTPSLTISDAATAVGRHRNTVRKALDAGKLPNASKGSDGSWLIPVTDLVAAGFELAAPDDAVSMTGKEPVRADEEVDKLRAALADAERRAAVAEALANERLGRIEDLRRGFNVLEAHEPPRTRWWHRRSDRTSPDTHSGLSGAP